jgi:nucleotide-binding universal stress UspA family protein
MNLLEEKINTHISLKNILLATDFSTVSTAALPYATALCLRYGSMIHATHVIPDSHLPVRPGAPDLSTMGVINDEGPSPHREAMQVVVRRLRGFAHQIHIRHGDPGEILAEMVNENEIDLLIAGTHGRTGVGRLVLGSVAEQIIRRVSCPVLTVGPKASTSNSETPASHRQDVAEEICFRRILYATDLAANSHAAPYAFSLAKEFGSRLTLLNVIEQYRENLHDVPGPIETALRRLEELIPEGNGFRHKPEPAVEFGPPAECILQAAAERESDLIVLGIRSWSSRVDVSSHLPLTTAMKVIAKANCPVLTVGR